MNRQFVSNIVNFLFAFGWLIFLSTFAFEIFNSFFSRPVYFITDPQILRTHRLVYFAIVAVYGSLFAVFYRDFFIRKLSLNPRLIRLGISFVLWLSCWYYIHNYFKFYWY